MAYTTSNYYLPDLTIDVSKNLPPTFHNKNSYVILSERKFPLNKSKCKFVSVGLAHDFDYDPCIKLFGNKCDAIIFNQNEWKTFLTYQGIITNYLYTNEVMEAIDAEKFRIDFEKGFSRFIKIWKNNSYICLGYETICKLWESIPVIEYRLDMLERLQFKSYFKNFHKGLQYFTGSVLQSALNLLRSNENRNSENVSIVMELIYIYPEVFEIECSKSRG